MPFVKSLTDCTIRTTLGHTIAVPADTPTYVPPEVMKYAKQQGLGECTEDGDLTLGGEGLARAAPRAPRDATTLGSPASRYGPTVMAEDSQPSKTVQVTQGQPGAEVGPGVFDEFAEQRKADRERLGTTDEAGVAVVGDSSAQREKALQAGLAKLYSEGKPEDFVVSSGHPKMKAIERVCGFPVSGAELTAALDRYQTKLDAPNRSEPNRSGSRVE